MDVSEVIATHKAIRAFPPDPVPLETVEQILALAARAPSGGNLQQSTLARKRIVMRQNLQRVGKAVPGLARSRSRPRRDHGNRAHAVLGGCYAFLRVVHRSGVYTVPSVTLAHRKRQRQSDGEPSMRLHTNLSTILLAASFLAPSAFHASAARAPRQ